MCLRPLKSQSIKQRMLPAKENIDAFIAGKLSLLDEIHKGFHGHGG